MQRELEGAYAMLAFNDSKVWRRAWGGAFLLCWERSPLCSGWHNAMAVAGLRKTQAVGDKKKATFQKGTMIDFDRRWRS